MYFINILPNVNIDFGSNWVKIQGPNGTLVKKKAEDLVLFKNSNKLYILNADSAKYEAFLKRLYNLMLGVTNGYTMKLRMIGVGYKIFIEEKSVTLKLGFSHEINYVLPEGIKVFQPKAKTPMFIIYGTELSKVAQVAAEIRKLREPEPYKGKGIRYFNEKINWKKGKKVNA